MIHSTAFNHTEPMTLGSPPMNPNGTGSNTSPNTCQYLPGFLMTDNVPITDTASTSPITETKVPRSNAFSSLSGNSHNLPASQYNINKLQSRYLSQPPESIGRRLTSPPTRSMWSIVNNASHVHTKSSIDNFNGIKHSTPNYTVNASINHPIVKQLGVSPFQSPIDSNSFRTPLHNVVNHCPPLHGSPPLHNNHNHSNGMIVNLNNGISTPDRLAEALLTQRNLNDFDHTQQHDCWVTVFGFPPSRAAFILNQFAQLGTIEKHVITNNGNWMHIKYQNKMQAHCALNKNGKVFGDNTMVGVSICTDSQIMNDDKCDDLLSKPTDLCNLNDSVFLSPSNINHHKYNHSNSTTMKRANDENYRAATPTQTTGTPIRDFNGLKSVNNGGGGGGGVGGGGFIGNGVIHTGMDSVNGFSDKSMSSNIGRHNSMRSLAASVRPTNLSRTTSVRQAGGGGESGLISKALGYMFGWS